MSNHLVNQIYNSRKYILEILEERGFDIEDYRNFSVDEIHVMVQNQQLDLLLTMSSNKKVYVKYNVVKALRPNILYDYVEDLFNIDEVLTKNDELIIINKDEPNDTMLNTMKNIWINDNIKVSIINIERLQFNILRHNLVPKHSILSDGEASLVRERYNITDDTKFPTISYFDPICMVLGIRPDNICKIERHSKTAIDGVFYRRCVIDVK